MLGEQEGKSVVFDLNITDIKIDCEGVLSHHYHIFDSQRLDSCALHR